MRNVRDLPERVRDTRLEATIHGHITVHSRPLGCRNAKPQKWESGGIIGRGADGIVTLQRKLEGPGTFDLLAVKQMRLVADLTSDNHDSQRYVRELEALAKFGQEMYSRYFVRSYGWYHDEKWLYIAMEHCKHMDLKTHLQNDGVLSEEDARTIASQVLEGVSLMHENGIAHRDLKPANILIQSKPPEDEAWWVVLADLGLSRRPGDASGTTTVRGTPDFMAPEIIGHPFRGHPKNANPFSADMWCLGETISYALTGRGTFRDNEHLLQYQANSVTFPYGCLREKGLSDDAMDFIRSLMKVQPSQRPTASQALQSPWITRMSSVTPDTTVVGSQTASVEPAVASSSAHSTPTQMTQASGQWTQTMPIYSQDTQASAAWTTTIANPGFQRSVPGSREPRNVPEPIETLNTQYPGFTTNPGHAQYYPHDYGNFVPRSSSGHVQQPGYAQQPEYSRYGHQPGYGGYGQQPGYALPGPYGYARYPVFAPPPVQHPAFFPAYPLPYRNFDPHAALDNSPYARRVPIPSYNPTQHQPGMRHAFAPTPLNEVEAVLREEATEKRGDRSHQTGLDHDTKDSSKRLSIPGKPDLVEKQRQKAQEQRKKAQDSKATQLGEFKKFSENFHLRTLIPADLVPILAKSEEKKVKILDLALQHADEKYNTGTPKETQDSTDPSVKRTPQQPPLRHLYGDAALPPATTPGAHPPPPALRPPLVPASNSASSSAAYGLRTLPQLHHSKTISGTQLQAEKAGASPTPTRWADVVRMQESIAQSPITPPKVEATKAKEQIVNIPRILPVRASADVSEASSISEKPDVQGTPEPTSINSGQEPRTPEQPEMPSTGDRKQKKKRAGHKFFNRKRGTSTPRVAADEWDLRGIGAGFSGFPRMTAEERDSVLDM